MLKLRHTPLSVQSEDVWLDGLLAHAPDTHGLILLPTNSGRAPLESRTAHTANLLQKSGYATLLFNLLTQREESRDQDIRYNVPLLAARMLTVLEWISHQPQLSPMPLAMVVSSTGCAAAIRAASRAPEQVKALVCRCGRPGLAGAGPLRLVSCPTLFITAGGDNGQASVRQAYEILSCERDWQTVEEADEHFLMPGMLDAATRLAADWLDRHVRRPEEVQPTSSAQPG